MRHRRLGHSGIEVSEIGLGTMMFGAWGNPDPVECTSMVDMALDAGITLFDTADIYDAGVSEEILGAALRGRRDGVVLATKVGNPVAGDPARSGLSRRWIVAACEDSLRRLGTDRIDLYQMHRPDPSTPIDETLSAFDELVRAGKVRVIGTSTFSAAQLRETASAADASGSTRPSAEQPPYSILARGIEAAVLPTCEDLGVGCLVWAPLNGGWLTGKYQRDDAVDASSRAVREPDHFDHRDLAMRADKRRRVAELMAIAARADVPMATLALAFVLARPAVASALIGPRTPTQLAELLAAADRPVDDLARVLAEIDEVVAPTTNVNPADAG